ncbi:MAG: hypothetical protein WC054_13170 [Candidatus Nanopelagicales bacterium]
MSPDLDDVAEWIETHICKGCADCRQATSIEFSTMLGLARRESTAVAKRLHGLTKYTCAYCGAASDTRDHLLPRNWSGEALRPFVPTVPACRDCNGRINDMSAPYIAARAERVAESLRRAHAKRLAAKDFTLEELAEFEGKLASQMRASASVKAEIRRRLAVLDLGGVIAAPDRLLPIANSQLRKAS